MDPITEKEKKALLEFREKVTDLELDSDQQTDGYLIRWLRARDLDVKKATLMLKNHLEWRKVNNMDELMKWEPPAFLKELCPYEYLGEDDEGSPTLSGHWDVKKLVQDVPGGKDLYLKYIYFIMETGLHQMKSRRLSDPSYTQTQVVSISDLNDFSLKKFTFKGSMDLLKTLSKRMEENYPEIIKSGLYINCPRAFAFIFNAMKPLIPARTLEKLAVHGSDPNTWLEPLQKKMPADKLPVRYGGPNDKVGKLFLEKPSSEWKPEDDSSLKHVKLNSKQKLELELDVDKEDTTICWKFRTEDYDIGFTLFDENKEQVVPYERVNSHSREQTGSYSSAKPGKYTVLFDNSFSYWRPKNLYYNVELKSPSQIFLEGDDDASGDWQEAMEN